MKIKEIDNYTYSVILGSAGVLSILGVGKSKAFVYITVILLLLAVYLLVYTYKKGTGSIVRNDYEGEAYTKTEDGNCEPEKLQSKQTRTGIDGIITNYDKKRVFKVSNGIKTKIDKQGKIKETTLIGRIINTGYTYQLKNSSCWQKLYTVL